MWGHMAGGGGLWMVSMVLWWLISLGVLFFVIYEAVYLAIRRALGEQSMRPGAVPTAQPPQPPPTVQPPQT